MAYGRVFFMENCTLDAKVASVKCMLVAKTMVPPKVNLCDGCVCFNLIVLLSTLLVTTITNLYDLNI